MKRNPNITLVEMYKEDAILLKELRKKAGLRTRADYIKKILNK